MPTTPSGLPPAGVRPVALYPFAATVHHALGIDPATIVYNHLNQPRELIQAEPITDLFG